MSSYADFLENAVELYHEIRYLKEPSYNVCVSKNADINSIKCVSVKKEPRTFINLQKKIMSLSRVWDDNVILYYFGYSTLELYDELLEIITVLNNKIDEEALKKYVDWKDEVNSRLVEIYINLYVDTSIRVFDMTYFYDYLAKLSVINIHMDKLTVIETYLIFDPDIETFESILVDINNYNKMGKKGDHLTYEQLKGLVNKMILYQRNIVYYVLDTISILNLKYPNEFIQDSETKNIQYILDNCLSTNTVDRLLHFVENIYKKVNSFESQKYRSIETFGMLNL